MQDWCIAYIHAGYPLTGFKVTLLDGAFHDVDSSVLAFEIASRDALFKSAKNLGLKIMELLSAVVSTHIYLLN